MKKHLLNIFFLFLSGSVLSQKIYSCDNGKVGFFSDAPLETISANSELLKGAIDSETRLFAFSSEIKSFSGFNNPLQKVHFNENYLESNRYPNATFSGKIIETIDFGSPGKLTVRVKGTLNIHGVERERIIRSEIDIKDKSVIIHAQFSVMLEEHDIRVPKVVNQKIAEKILVTVDAELSLNQS
jgi:hypothetical protein